MRVSEAAAIIGVAEDCSESELKNAYRALARVHHPDKVEEEKKEDAVVKFQQIGAALEVMGRERVRGGGAAQAVPKELQWRYTHTHAHPRSRAPGHVRFVAPRVPRFSSNCSLQLFRRKRLVALARVPHVLIAGFLLLLPSFCFLVLFLL